MKIAINGFGRIGRTFFRLAFKRKEVEVIAINDLGDLANLAYLLKYDTVYRIYDKKIKIDEEKKLMIVEDKKIKFLQEKDPALLPWKDLNIDVVVESTGFFESFEKASAHIKAGAKKVVISAPAKDSEGIGKTILLGINETEFKSCVISSNGSCTTNAVAPIAAIMSETVGVEKAFLNTIHAYTATQRIVDGPDSKDWRRGRAAAYNIVPSTTGAAISVARVIKDIEGVFDGIAMRVPTICGSIADFTFVAKKQTNVEEINNIFKKAAKEKRWKGILKVVEEPIVSADIIGDIHAAIVDLSFTKVIGGNLVKILSWYDNEWGYSNTLVEHVIKAGQNL